MGRKSNEYHKMMDNLLAIKKNIKNISKDAAKYACDYIELDLTNIFDSCIDKFYKSYKPRYYKRKKELYNIYRINNTGNSISWNFSPDNMNSEAHRVSIDYIYHWVFEEGYHGGAHVKLVSSNLWGENTSNDSMLWRTPVPAFANGENPYNRWSVIPGTKQFTPVSKSESPAEMITNEIEKYKKDGRLDKALSNALEDALFNYNIII